MLDFQVWELTANKVIMVSAIGNDGPLYGYVHLFSFHTPGASLKESHFDLVNTDSVDLRKMLYHQRS